MVSVDVLTFDADSERQKQNRNFLQLDVELYQQRFFIKADYCAISKKRYRTVKRLLDDRRTENR